MRSKNRSLFHHPRRLYRLFFSRLQRRSNETPKHRQMDIRLISAFFDSDYYADTYLHETDSFDLLLDGFIEEGFELHYNPCRSFDCAFYLSSYADVREANFHPLAHFILFGFSEGRLPCEAATFFTPEQFLFDERQRNLELNSDVSVLASIYLRSLDSLVSSENFTNQFGRQILNGHGQRIDRFIQASVAIPPKLLTVSKQAQPTVNLVVESIPDRIVARRLEAALITSYLLADRLGFGLRILTTHRDSAALAKELLTSNGFEPSKSIQIEQVRDGGPDIATVSNRDVFIAASWKSMASLQSINNGTNCIHLISDDERLHESSGDLILAAREWTTSPRCFRIINSSNLYRHFISSGITFDPHTSVHFQPSYALARSFRPDRMTHNNNKQTLRVFVTAIRSCPTSLFFTSIRVLEQVLSDWDNNGTRVRVYCAGDPVFPIPRFGNDTLPIFVGRPGPRAYMSLLSKIDVVLDLKTIPYVSSSTMEALAAGSRVVRNSWPHEGELEPRVEGLWHQAPDVYRLATALREALLRAGYAGATAADLPDIDPEYWPAWPEQLNSVIDFLEARCG